MPREELQPFNEMKWFAGRARESRFRLSEHVLRVLISGEVAMSDIVTVLLSGVVLEEHRNPRRATSYLVYAASSEKPIHLLCADGGNGWLLVLFAYVPAPPVWASPTRRSGGEGVGMEKSVGKCFFCGGDLVEITMANFDYRREGRLCVVKKLPATLCRQCDEKYINADVGQRLNALIDEGKFSGSESAVVIDYTPEGTTS